MKYILLITLMFLTLNAKIDEKQMYAKVNAKSVDLYSKPYECSKKKVGYYKQGDMIAIEYCNGYKWCKAPNGYVKKDLLRLPQPLLSQNKPLVKSAPLVRKKEVKEVELISEPVIIEVTDANSEVEEIVNAVEIEKDAYDEYFSGESAKVIFREVK